MKTKRIVSITLACVLLATAVITGIALFVTNNKPVVADKDNVLDSNLVASIDAPGKVKLIQTPLRAASSNADSFVLTATVDSTDSDLNAIEWSTEFANPSSAWATGKKVSDYVTITVDGSDPNKVTVKNTAPFGEVINVVAKAKYFDVSAKCKLDYIKRIEDVQCSIVSSKNNETNVLFLNEENEYSVEIVPTYGVGTIAGKITYDGPGSYILLDGDKFSAVTGQETEGGFVFDNSGEVGDNSSFELLLVLSELPKAQRKICANKLLKYMFGENLGESFLNDGLFTLNIAWTYTYGGKQVGKACDEYAGSVIAPKIYRNGVNLYSEVGNITLSESGYAF